MKPFPRSIFFAVAAVVSQAYHSARGDVQPVPLVPEVPSSTLYEVYVDDGTVPVGVETTGGKTFHAAAVSYSNRVNVRIVVSAGISQCTIRPLRFGLSESAKIVNLTPERTEITFPLSEPQKLIVEIDELPPLVLVGSPLDDDMPDPNAPDVIYFPPGVHEPGRIRMKSNQTVYLAAGAKVYGTIEGTCVKNVRVTGRGHLYGTKHTNWGDRTYGIIFDRCQNVTVEKIGIRDCYWWTTKFLLCDGVEISDINLLTFNRNNGGLMIDGCSRLTARDSLLMSMDDCICPHALNAAGNGEELSHDLLFENLVLYNVLTGNAIRIGASFETQEVRNWRFRNIDVVHRKGAAVYADHSDWATVRNLSFENFFDEVPGNFSIDMRIDKTRYSCQTGYRDERGAFDGLAFVNFRSSGGKISLKGFDNEHLIDNVVFAGCRIGDVPVLSVDDITMNEFVRNVTFSPSDAPVTKPGADEVVNQAAAESNSPSKLLIDDRDDKRFRSFGFVPTSLPGNAHGDSAGIGQVADAFGKYAAAIYEPGISGRYTVEAYCGNLSDMDERAPWIIKHRDGYSRAYIDQNGNPGWHSLGTYEFDGKSNVRLVYPNYFEPTKRPVVADAVRFLREEH